MGKIKARITQAVDFFTESWTELSKVHFSTPKEAMRATAVVVVITLLMAVWLGLVDLAATRVVRQLLS
ncbi:MAG TPA: preprotein translocase subunit SecE [Candidatus Binataceae bacterium]|nr:preprotein translocase subunit SecE [Candidatus Binataceae bacterium]